MTIVFSLYKIVSTRINEKLSFIFLISLWISFEKFHLITKSEHQNEKSILNNRDVIESLNSYAEEFLDL